MLLTQGPLQLGCIRDPAGAKAAHHIHSTSGRPPDLPMHKPARALRVSAVQTDLPFTRSGPIDYYELLGVDDDATHTEIKSAYRSLAKQCHPDILGTAGHEMSILLNEAFQVLTDYDKRYVYNEELQEALTAGDDDYTGVPLSKWLVGHKLGKATDLNEQRAVFVDEGSCIGCKQCVWLAPATFRMESDYGRSRVFAQWANTEDDIDAAIQSCPVDCIHWTTQSQLASLEYMTRKKSARVNVGAMMGGAGGPVHDVFSAAERFVKARGKREKWGLTTPARDRRSASSEDARRAAAREIRKRDMGVFAGVVDAIEDAIDGLSHATAPQDVNEKVGRRRRQRRIKTAQQGVPTVPRERALVLWERH